MAGNQVHGWRRVLKWFKRGVLGLLVLVVVVVGGALWFIHSDYGRNKIRGIANDQLAQLFTGGGSIGKIDGSPFGELILHDVVINGPDKKPAITIKTLRVSVGVFDLVKHNINLHEIVAEDVDVAVKRAADGSFEMARLLAPQDPNKPQTKSSWNVDLGDVGVVRAHVMVDTGQPDLGIVNLDDVVIDANAHLHTDGVKAGGVRIGATWRERKALITILASFRDDADSTQAKHLDVSVGGVSVTTSNVEILKSSDGKFPRIAGQFIVHAPKAAVAALIPRIQLPGDVALSLVAGAPNGTMIPITLAGSVGAATVKADLQADPDAKHVTGHLQTNELDLAVLTQNKIIATGGLAATFDVAMGAAGELPTATASLSAHGTYQDIPRTELTAQLTSKGQHVTGDIAVTGAMQAKIKTALTRVGDGIHLDLAHVTASVADPKTATGGLAPFHGQLALVVDANGVLTPRPDLAVKANIDGKRLRMQDLSIATLAVTVDGTHLPYQPHGRATVKATDIIRGEMQFGRIELDAHDRSDGKIAVHLTSHPNQDPWLIDLAALVTPPGSGNTVAIDLGEHRVRAGNGTTWTGNGGHIEIAPNQISLANFASTSGDGSIALGGTYNRTNGDLRAKADVDRFELAALAPSYRGELAAHVAMTRSHSQLNGTVELSGTGLAVDKTKPPIDLQAKIAIKPGALTVDAKAGSDALGTATVALDLATPRDIADVPAWKRAGRGAIRSAKIALANVDLDQVANLLATPVQTRVLTPDHLVVLGHLYALTRPAYATPVTVTKPKMGGHLDGELAITATTLQGDFKVKNLHVPQVRGLGRVDVELAIEQPSLQQVIPTVTIRADQVGTVTAKADLKLPANVFDPREWQQLGLKAVNGATVRTTDVVIDPAMLERFGIASSMRGRANVGLEVGPGLQTVNVVLNVADLRGSPLAQPVDVRFEASLDGKFATAKLAMTTKQGKVTLLTLDGKLPVTLKQLRTDPASLQVAPLDATIALEKTSASALLGVFGRTEITGGTLDGKVTVTGSIKQPKAVAHITAEDIVSMPGARSKPTPVMKSLVLDATYDGQGGKVTIAGVEDTGGKLDVTAAFDLKQLSAGSATIKATEFDMKPLLAFAPDPASAAKGVLGANLAIKGFDPRTAQITGELHITHARLPIAPTVGTVRQATVNVTFEAKQIKLDAAGKLGKGDLKLDGTVAINGASLSGGQAKLILRHVSPIGSIEPEINAEITAKIGRKNEKWIADVVVDKGWVKITKSSGEALKPVGPPNDLYIGPKRPAPKQVAARGKDSPDAPPPPAQPGLIAHITLHPIKVEAEEFRTTVHGKLDVTTDANTIGVKGSIEASSGDLTLFDRRYRIERAAVIFDGSTDPNLQVRITHDFPDVTTITEVRGRLSNPDLVLSSSPGQYSQSELLGFLLGGEPNGDPQSGSARDNAAQLGSSIVANQIGGYIKKALPFDIDVLRYEAATANSSAAIIVGSWITHTLFFSFSQHLAARPDENSGEGTLEYWLTRRLELELTIGDRNYDGVDLLWRKRY